MDNGLLNLYWGTCGVLAAFGKSNVERTRQNDVYDYFAKQVKDVLAPGMLLSGYVKSWLDKDEAGDLKKFILNFLKASDFDIADMVLHEEDELITPELEQLIQNAPIDKEAKAFTPQPNILRHSLGISSFPSTTS